MADLENEKRRWANELEGWSTSAGKRMHPRRFLRELSLAMPEGSIVATDIGNNSSMCNAYFRFSGIRQHLSALSWGNCGFAYGAALGAKIGRPEAPVFAFQGDGAYGISGIAEVMTAVREQIPVIAIVANNLERFGFDRVELQRPVDSAEIAVPPGTPLKTLAKAAGVTDIDLANSRAVLFVPQDGTVRYGHGDIAADVAGIHTGTGELNIERDKANINRLTISGDGAAVEVFVQFRTT